MSDSKPYRDGPSIKTGDLVVFVDGDGGRTEGIAHVDSGLGSGFYHSPTRETRITIIPDGEPMQYGRDYAFAPMPDWLPEKPSNVELVETDIPAIDANLTFTAHRWLQGDPIPYDEMRRLCGLPDIPDLRAAAFFGDAPSNPWTIFRSPGDPFITWTNPLLPNAAMTRRQATLRLIAERLRELGVLPQWSLPDDPIDPSAWTVQVDEPEPETPQQRALPRPSTTPPPWADNPAGQRRPTKTRNHRRVK